MKNKSTIIAAAFFLLAGSLQAQDQNLLNNTGNVGIGTSLPTEKLQVKGNIKVDSALLVSRSAEIGQDLTVTGNVLIMGDVQANNRLYLPHTDRGETTGNQLMMIDEAGLVSRLDIPTVVGTVYQPLTCPSSGLVNPTWTNAPSKLYVNCPDDLKVGIGTSAPTHRFHVVGDGMFNGILKVSDNLAIGGEINGNGRLLVRNTSHDIGLYIQHQGNNKLYNKLILLEYSHPSTEIIKVVNTTNNNVPFLLTAAGKMIVHNGTKKTLQLNEDGVLYARKIKVDTDNWADFVFEKDYQLMPLAEVKQFIQSNKHLPDIPSEKELKENGLDLAEMNRLLMQKVEELTLYMIQLQEKVDQLESKK